MLDGVRTRWLDRLVLLESILTLENLSSLLALSALEIVLGIDNIVFIAIMVDRLPKEKRRFAYRLGLAGALLSRLGLLFTLAWLAKLKEPLFWPFGHPVSGRDLILLCGGLFLLFKSSQEIFNKVEVREKEREAKKGGSLVRVVAMIMVIDIVFSLDSVITAVGIAPALWVMVTAIVVAIAVMMIFAQPLGEFINRNPSMQILALSFLLLIGVLLVAEGTGQEVSKGYVYFAMGFSLLVELFNMRHRAKQVKKQTPNGPAPPAGEAVGAPDD